MQGIASEATPPASLNAAGRHPAPASGYGCEGMRMDERLTVRLHKILRAPWAIPPVDSYRVIGTVHRGMEFGFLAIARDGGYLQVNGSVVQRLNRRDVDAAINNAEHLFAAKPAQAQAAVNPAGPVTVIRKKRRTPADAELAP